MDVEQQNTGTDTTVCTYSECSFLPEAVEVDNEPTNVVVAGDSSVAFSSEQETTDDCKVSGISFQRLSFWNSALIGLSLILSITQCIASVLLLTKLHDDPSWPGSRLKVFDVWFPGVVSGLAGLLVGMYCLPILKQAKELAERAHKALSNQKSYIPWNGLEEIVCQRVLLWIIIVPNLFSFAILVVEGCRTATVIRLVFHMERIPDPQADHALAVALLCFHLLMLICQLFVFSLGFLIPATIAVMAKCFAVLFKEWLYPFAVFLDEESDGKPLLVET